MNDIASELNLEIKKITEKINSNEDLTPQDLNSLFIYNLLKEAGEAQ